MKERIKGLLHWIVFGLYLIIHFAITVMSTYYGDDYYYAYFVKKGISNYIARNIYHYKEINGRAIVHALDELLIGYSFWIWRVFSLILIAAFILIVASIASKRYLGKEKYNKNHFALAMILSCGFFAFFDIWIFTETVYYATSAMNYVFPTVMTLLLYYVFRKDYEDAKGRWWLVILAFVASCTTEQAAVAATAISAMFIVLTLINKEKKTKVIYIISFVLSLIGNAILFCSPGNSERMTYYEEFYSYTFLEKIQYNWQTLLAKNKGTLVLVSILLLIETFVFIKKSKQFSKFKSFIYGFMAVITGSGTVFTAIGSVEGEYFEIGMIVALIAYVFVIIDAIIGFFKDHECERLYFPVCALVLQLALLISPEIGARTIFITASMLTVAIVYELIHSIDNKDNIPLAFIVSILFLTRNTPSISDITYILHVVVITILGIIVLAILKRITIRNVLICMLCALSICQFYSIKEGYEENYSAVKNNEKLVEEYLEGDMTGSLALYYMPNNIYTYTWPYSDPYHESVFKELYGIPSDTEMVYVEIKK